MANLGSQSVTDSLLEENQTPLLLLREWKIVALQVACCRSMSLYAAQLLNVFGFETTARVMMCFETWLGSDKERCWSQAVCLARSHLHRVHQHRALPIVCRKFLGTISITTTCRRRSWSDKTREIIFILISEKTKHFSTMRDDSESCVSNDK